MSSLLSFVLVLIIAGSCTGSTKKNAYQLMAERSPFGNEKQPKDVTEAWFTQKLNHYDALDTRTWQQRYFYSSDEYRQGGPVFLFISGEWESSGNSIGDLGFVRVLAKEHGAFLIDLEHRYYGQSRPTPNLTVENMRFLQSEQALEDAAVFTQAMMNSTNFDLSGPWFVFGLSYSGMLAAWARGRYPHLYYAAYSSCGPVLAQLDHHEYHVVVTESMRSTLNACPLIVEAAMNQLYSEVEKGNANYISSLFNMCDGAIINVTNPDDNMNLYNSIAAKFANLVQYARLDDIPKDCITLVTGQDDALGTVAKMVNDFFTPFCIPAVNQEILDDYRDEVDYTPEITRQWYYQTCTEFGDWASLSNPNTMFGSVSPVEYYLLFCNNVYGPEFTKSLSEAGIARTNLMHGGLNPDSTRVLYTQGTLDPWRPLGIQSSVNQESPVVILEGISHVQDIFPVLPDDSENVKAARDIIAAIIRQWVSQAMEKLT